MKSENYLQGSC